MNKILELLNNQNENASLLTVLESYAAATPDGNDFAVLQHWIKRFPQFSEGLTAFAAERDLLDYAPLAEIEIADEEKYLAASRQTLRKFLANKQEQSAPESLLNLAKQKGISIKKMAALFCGSVSLLMYFENRNLDAGSISRGILRKVADALEIGEQAVLNYLNQPSKLANVSFKAQNRPTIDEKKSFADAVREDETLSPEQKKSLLESLDDY